MKGWNRIGALASVPLLLAAVVWQTGRFAAQASEARILEEEQRAWVDANRKLQGGISVLESRERSADLANKLGLSRASADKRLFIVTPSATGGLAPAPQPNTGRNDG